MLQGAVLLAFMRDGVKLSTLRVKSSQEQHCKRAAVASQRLQSPGTTANLSAAAAAWLDGDKVNAITVQAIAEYAGRNFVWTFVFMSIGFTGLASALQSTDKISKPVGYILAVISVIMLIINVGGIDAEGAGFIVFLGVMIATVAGGVGLIRQQA